MKDQTKSQERALYETNITLEDMVAAASKPVGPGLFDKLPTDPAAADPEFLRYCATQVKDRLEPAESFGARILRKLKAFMGFCRKPAAGRHVLTDSLATRKTEHVTSNPRNLRDMIDITRRFHNPEKK